jgi:PAS domain S-box-containing protein
MHGPVSHPSRGGITLIERERQVLRDIARGAPLAQVLDQLLRAVEEEASSRMLSSILFLSDDGQHLLHGAAPSLPPAYNEAIHGIRIGEGVGSCGTAVFRAAPVYVSNIGTDPLWEDFRDLALSFGLRACWSTPILDAESTVLGTFAIYYPEPREPTEADIEAIAFIAQTAGLAIERHRFETELLNRETELKKLNAELKQRADAQRERFEQAPGFICILEGPEHVFEFVNAGHRELFNSAAWIGKPVREAFPDIEGQGFYELLDQVYATGLPYVGRAVASTFRVGGQGLPEERFQDFVYAPTRNADGEINGIICIGSDVTESHRAKQELERLNAELEQKVIQRTLARGVTWQITPDLMTVVNDDGQFEATNPAWQKVLGWSERDLSRKPFLDFVHPDDLAATREIFEALVAGTPVLRYVNRYRTSGGAFRSISWVAVPEDGKYYCIGRDVTEELERAELLAKRTADRDRMWRLSTDIMLVANFEADIVSMNPAWTTILGWSEEELIGSKFMDLVHPDDVESTLAEVGKLSEGATTFRFENRYRKKDGRYCVLSWTAVPDDKYIHAVGRDITAERAAAEQLANTQEALRQAQKMEAVGQLTGGVAHDFNNMLAVVSGSLELLDRRIGADDPRAKRHIAAALEAARRSSNLTQRLLAFSRQQPLQPEPIPPNRLVSGMSDLFTHSLGAQIQLETVLAAGIWNIFADQNQLENVLLNLAVNARDAMPDGGKLTIETHNAHIDERYAAGEIGVAPGQYVMIAVTDTGTGMPPEVIEKAFDPFFTTKEVGKGTGLGLSQVYGFVKQSGGHIKIYSEVGHGTTFKIYLPRYRGEAGASDTTQDVADLQGTAEQELILVVDDEPFVRQFSVDALTDLGYRVLDADGAKSAIALLKERPDVDLLFTDIVMPELNGRKLAETVKEFRPDLPVIYTTGYTRDAIIHNGVLDPGVHLLGKPFSIEQLASKVREVLDAAKLENARG